MNTHCSEVESKSIEQQFSDYKDDIYKFYHLQESQISINSKGYEVNLNMRKNIIDWLIHKHYEQKLIPETLYLCVNILDRFLSKIDYEVTIEKEFKLIGITSLFLASKYEQSTAVSIYDIEEYLVEYGYSSEEICEMEKVILQKLNWNLSVPTIYVFLSRNIRACGEDKIIENMVFFFSELSLTHYPIVCDYKPSMIAASAVFCARSIVGRYPFWSNDLKMCSGYSKEKLIPCVKVMMKLCNQICSDENMEVFKKFSSFDQCRVSYIAQNNLEQCLSAY